MFAPKRGDPPDGFSLGHNENTSLPVMDGEVVASLTYAACKAFHPIS
jgi:hypothetical protein